MIGFWTIFFGLVIGVTQRLRRLRPCSGLRRRFLLQLGGERTLRGRRPKRVVCHLYPRSVCKVRQVEQKRQVEKMDNPDATLNPHIEGSDPNPLEGSGFSHQSLWRTCRDLSGGAWGFVSSKWTTLTPRASSTHRGSVKTLTSELCVLRTTRPTCRLWTAKRDCAPLRGISSKQNLQCHLYPLALKVLRCKQPR